MPSDSTNPSAEEIQVVAIGASAGGLKALESFFRSMPSDSGYAFVVAMHLSQDHESQLASVLRAFTDMPVTQVGESVDIVTDHVYVIAPDQHLYLKKGRLHPSKRTPDTGVIDHLFSSLANDHRDRAIGIVLSGSGSDGTRGMTEISERGGILFAQDPDDADYSSMPNSIINTSLVDSVLPAADIPKHLLDLRDGTPREKPGEKQPEEPSEESGEKRREEQREEPRLDESARQDAADEELLRDIFCTIDSRTGYDLSRYKRSTILRQLHRRMAVVQARDLAEYARLVRQDTEAETLFKMLLISVTEFFRDAEAYKELERTVVPDLFQQALSGEGDENGGIRVWVPGCATGEEVYSIAMLMIEQNEAAIERTDIQFLATDIDEKALAVARRKIYAEDAVSGLDKERLNRFFIKKEGSYELIDEIRSLVVFASHDVTSDPPFMRLDLVSCRNLLMYFEPGMQRKILQRLAFGLRPGGYLFLGSAEGVNTPSDLFEPVSKKIGLYQRTSAVCEPHMLDVPRSRRLENFGLPSLGTKSDSERSDADKEVAPQDDPEGAPSQQDLMIANQEMQSLNEQLRSMMEELEVAKEELQSLNEELTTVNQELQNKIEEHRRVNKDLHVLIESTHLATIFLDRDLKVVLFTPESKKLYNLLPVDIGRSFEHFSHRLRYEGVLDDARTVLETGEEVKREVQSRDGTWYAMRAMPYRSPEEPVDGVVLTFADITSQKKVEEVSKERFSLAFHAGPMAAGIVSQDDGCFIDVNHIFEEITGYERDQIVGRPASEIELYLGTDIEPATPDVVLSPKDHEHEKLETGIRTRSGNQRDLVVSTTAIDYDGRPCYLSLFYDVTERKRLEREILLISDREQRRIGVDLHDGLGAHLTGISLMARGLSRNIKNGKSVAAEEIDGIAELLREGIEQARTLAQGLNPFMLESRGLTTALTELASHTERVSDITCTFNEEGDDIKLSNEQCTHLYRIAQEAVTNAVRHAEADRIDITLSKRQGRYRLSVSDDGKGIDSDQNDQKDQSEQTGLGKNIMRYRAEMIGAQLNISGAAGHGTKVTCTLRNQI